MTDTDMNDNPPPAAAVQQSQGTGTGTGTQAAASSGALKYNATMDPDDPKGIPMAPQIPQAKKTGYVGEPMIPQA